MPAHKYYCDYCDKQFYDTPKSRKRHLEGISHQRAKKQWFDSFREPEAQVSSRLPCTYFLRTGTCQYGSGCRLEHPVQFPSAPPPPVPSAPSGALRAPEAALANVLMKDLPLSLRPPPEGGHPPVAFVDWG